MYQVIWGTYSLSLQDCPLEELETSKLMRVEELVGTRKAPQHRGQLGDCSGFWMIILPLIDSQENLLSSEELR